VEIPNEYPTLSPDLKVVRKRPEIPNSGDSNKLSDSELDDSEDETSDGECSTDEDEEDLDHPLYPNSAAPQLQDYAEEQAAKLVGEVAVFSVVSALQEKLADLVRLQVEKSHADEAARILAEEEAEAAKFRGTQVTPERFLAWKKVFDAEMALLKKKRLEEAESSSKKSVSGIKLTGRQLFESDKSLMTSDTVFIGDGMFTRVIIFIWKIIPHVTLMQFCFIMDLIIDDESVDPSLFTEAELDLLADLDLEDDENNVTAMLLRDRED
jgi:hypothetical protein